MKYILIISDKNCCDDEIFKNQLEFEFCSLKSVLEFASKILDISNYDIKIISEKIKEN